MEVQAEKQTDSGGDSHITFMGRRRNKHVKKKKRKNPWNLREELEGNADPCNSNKLDSSSLVTSSPPLLQPHSFYRLGAERSLKARRQLGHSAAGATACQKVRLTVLRTVLTRRQEAGGAVVRGFPGSETGTGVFSPRTRTAATKCAQIKDKLWNRV